MRVVVLNRRLSSVYELIPTDLPEKPFALGGFTSKGEENVLSKLSGCDVVFLGEHHDSQKDHDLQVRPRCFPLGATTAPFM